MAKKFTRRFAYGVALAAFIAVWIITFYNYSSRVFFQGTAYAGTAIIELHGVALDSNLMQRQVKVIMSPVVMGPASKKLGSVDFWKKLLSLPPGIGIEASELNSFLANEIWVTVVPDSTQIKIQSISPKAIESALMANCVADSYRDFMANNKNQIQVQIVDRAQPALQPWKNPDAAGTIFVGAVMATFYGAIASGLAILSVILLRKLMPVQIARSAPSNFTCTPIKPRY
jgi:capsular polysaccharide biosynthesis protein